LEYAAAKPGGYLGKIILTNKSWTEEAPLLDKERGAPACRGGVR